uniref:Uncharacterized protein n=1 Tax=Anguilla anguilla TaxID=7936 RepID=A0A0E9QFA4_ANGAN
MGDYHLFHGSTNNKFNKGFSIWKFALVQSSAITFPSQIY